MKVAKLKRVNWLEMLHSQGDKKCLQNFIGKACRKSLLEKRGYMGGHY
jgi:hypothetical protein